MAETSTSSRDTGGYASASEGRTPTSVKDKAHEEATALAAKGKEAGASAVEKTKDVASSVVQRMGDIASTIGHKTEGAVGSVGGEMKSLAGTIRDNTPSGGVFGSAASGVASTLESGGAYLQEHNLHRMAEDATALIRRYPLQAILTGIGVGFLVGRASRS
jgi:hypothetical protein